MLHLAEETPQMILSVQQMEIFFLFLDSERTEFILYKAMYVKRTEFALYKAMCIKRTEFVLYKSMYIKRTEFALYKAVQMKYSIWICSYLTRMKQYKLMNWNHRESH